MRTFTAFGKFSLFLYALAILLFCHHVVIRPILLDWGSSEYLQNLILEGDKLTKGTKHTRAVLIEATPEEIWPWLVQVGQERGGFYSYQWLENVFFADMKNVYEIKPEFQQERSKGDTVWLASKSRYNASGYQVVALATPARSFVMVGGEDYVRIQNDEPASGSWAFYLQPAGENVTWLIARSSDGDTPWGNRFLRYFTYEVPHFIMERKMLVTIKELAEKKGHHQASLK